MLKDIYRINERMLYSIEFNIATKMPWIRQLIGKLCVCVCVCVRAHVCTCTHVHTHGVAHLCSTLCNPMDYSLPGSSVRGIFWQEYWSGLPFPTPGDIPNPGNEPKSLHLLHGQTGSFPLALPEKIGKIPWRREWQLTLVYLGLPWVLRW